MEHERILISTEELQKTVACLAERINMAYANIDNVMALVILEGAKYFAKDLLEQLLFPIEVEHLKASSYQGTTQSSGVVNIETSQDLARKIRGKNILIVDDIYDTGRTLSHLLEWIENHDTKSIKTCVLLEKEIPHDENITINFLGTTVPDVFVVGYGLDFDGKHRELPFIVELAQERIEE